MKLIKQAYQELEIVNNADEIPKYTKIYSEGNTIEELYFNTKEVLYRWWVLKKIVFNSKKYNKEFFLKAFNKERYWDMKLLAIRGYAAHATEEEVNILVYRLLEILKKWYKKNPDCYAYKNYNLLRSDFMIKYLLKKYKKYQCFKDFNEQLEKQYNAMPDAFKGLHTYDKNSNCIELVTREKYDKLMEEYYQKNR